ncbi:MAG: hypothetical protein HQ575_01245 [Candidatus Omnitrophica bacterium]|nr:hypothetical protein [Candidatus Omnitrophota bacterium]
MKKAYLILSIIVMLLACGILAINPSYADILYEEGQPVEVLTIVMCAIALVPSLILLFKKIKERSGYGFWLFLSIFLIIFIGDESSWGMSFFGFTKHKIAGVGFDGLHDILGIGIGAIKKVRNYIRSIGFTDIRSIAIFIISGLSIITAAYLSIRLLIKNRNDIYNFFSKNIKWEPFFFLLVGLIILGTSMLIDEDNLINFPHKKAVEESFEFLSASALFFAAISELKRKRCTT